MKKVNVVIFIFFFSACSRIEFAANWADTYVTSQLDKYFDINSIQSQFIKKNLKADIEVIKKKIFPRVANELEKISAEIESLTSFNKDMVYAHEEELKKIFYDAVKVFEHSAVEFAAQLNAEQLKSFKKEFNSKTEDIQEFVDDPVGSRDKRFEKTRKYIESWIGKLTAEQRTSLGKFTQLNLFPYTKQIMNREKLSREFAESFTNMEKRKKYVSELFLNYETLREASYSKALAEDQDALFELLAKMLNQLTSEQRKFLRDILKDRVHQLRDSAEGKKRGLFNF